MSSEEAAKTADTKRASAPAAKTKKSEALAEAKKTDEAAKRKESETPMSTVVESVRGVWYVERGLPGIAPDELLKMSEPVLPKPSVTLDDPVVRNVKGSQLKEAGVQTSQKTESGIRMILPKDMRMDYAARALQVVELNRQFVLSSKKGVGGFLVLLLLCLYVSPFIVRSIGLPNVLSSFVPKFLFHHDGIFLIVGIASLASRALIDPEATSDQVMAETQDYGSLSDESPTPEKNLTDSELMDSAQAYSFCPLLIIYIHLWLLTVNSEEKAVIPAIYLAIHTGVSLVVSLGWTLIFLSFFNTDWIRFGSGLVSYLALVLEIIFLRLHVNLPRVRNSSDTGKEVTGRRLGSV